MRFTTAKRCAQLQYAVTASASQHAQHLRKNAAQFGGKIRGLVEGAGVAIDGPHTLVSLHDFAQVHGIGVHRELSLHDVAMWCDHAIPCWEGCSAAIR